MALNPKLKVEILDLKAGLTSWTDITTAVKNVIGGGGMLGPQSPNPIPGQCTLLLKNSSGSYTPGTNTIVEPGNIVRVLTRSLLGLCLRNTHAGTNSTSTFKQQQTKSISASDSFTLTWYARTPWDSKWNTDSVYLKTSAETAGAVAYTYTNKWVQYSYTFTAAGPATYIECVFSPDLTRTAPYQYVEYKNISLKRAGIELLTNTDFSGGTTNWTITNSGAGTYTDTIVDDTYTEFYGFIEDVPFVPYPTAAAEVTLVAYDFVTRFAMSKMAAPLQRNKRADELILTALDYVYENPAATYRATGRSLGPRRWLRLDEATGSTTAADSGVDGLSATYNASTTFGVATPFTNGDTSKAITLAAGQYLTTSTFEIANRDWSFCGWINPTNTGGGLWDIISFTTGSEFLSVWTYPDGQFGIRFPNTGTLYSSSPTNNVSFGNWHFVAVTYSYNSRTLRLYVDNVLVKTTSNVPPFTTTTPTVRIGGNTYATDDFRGSLKDLMLFDVVVTAAQLSTLYSAAFFDAELQKRWLPGIKIETGTQVFSVAFDGYDATKTTIADVLADCATSEAGRFYFDRDGTLRFRNRDWALLWRNRLNSPAYTNGEVYRNLTLVSGTGGTAYNPVPIYAGSGVVNRVKVSYRPRTTNSGAIVAVGQIPSIVTVPPLQAGSYGKSDAVPGETTITIHFRDSSNNSCAATNIQFPLVYYSSASPATPYDVRVVGDIADETNGTDYTPGSVLGGYFQLQVLNISASEATIRLLNYAIGNLYVTKLQLRGYTVTSFDPVTKEAIDTTSRRQVGERVMSKFLPFCSDGNFAQSLAEYYLLRFSAPFAEYAFEFENVNSIGGVDLLSIELGDTIGIDSPSGTAHTVASYNFDLTPNEGKISFQGNRADTQIFGSYDTDYTVYDTLGAVYGI